MKPLTGVRVLDFTHAYAGPYCTYLLSLLGADVIKVESPQGDEHRSRSQYSQLNAGKRSIVIDLKSAEGQQIAHRLAAESEIVVENFRPGVAQSLGVDWDTLSKATPGLVYCSISGFGQSGPQRAYPAIEWSVQAATGLTSLYLHPGSDPMFTGLSILDPFSGYMAQSTILAALLERNRTGLGRHLDISMAEGALVLQAARLFEGLKDPSVAKDGGYRRRPTMARFATADGKEIFVAGLHNKWFAGICRALDADVIVNDSRFASVESRAEHAEELFELLQQRILRHDSDDLEARLVAVGIPASVVRTIDEFAASDQVTEAGLFGIFEKSNGETGQLFVPSFGAAAAETLAKPVRDLGADTVEVLAGLGLGEDDVQRLVAADVVQLGAQP